MRLILQSPYLTIEYLLWRAFNIPVGNDSFSTLFLGNLEKVELSLVPESNRNLCSKLSIGDKIYILKQYGSLSSRSFLDNEKKVLDFLTSKVDSKNEFTKDIVFYDETNKILCTEYFGDLFNLKEYIKHLVTNKNESVLFELLVQITNYSNKVHSTLIQDCTGFEKAKKARDVISYENQLKADKYFNQFASDWRPTSLIHFDFRLGNFLANDDKVKIIDWEMAVIGDRFWDISRLLISLCTCIINFNFFTSDVHYQNHNLVFKCSSLVLKQFGIMCKESKEKLKVFILVQLTLDLQKDTKLTINENRIDGLLYEQQNQAF